MMTNDELKDYEILEQEPKPQKKGFWGLLYEIFTYQPDPEVKEIKDNCTSIFDNIKNLKG